MSKKVIFLVLCVSLILTGCGKKNQPVEEPPKEEKKSNLEQFLENIDNTKTYSYNVDISLYSEEVNKQYSLYEETSKDKTYINTGDYGKEFLIPSSSYYNHYVENKKEDNSYYKEKIQTNNVSIIELVKNIEWEDKGELNDYHVYTSEVDLSENYIYELHDFVRIIKSRRDLGVSGKVKITVYLKEDIIHHIEIDASADAFNMLNINNISEFKLDYKNFNFDAKPSYILPNSFSMATELSDKYKKIESKPTEKKKKKNNNFEWSSSYNTVNIRGVDITIGKSTVSALMDNGVTFELNNDEGDYYILIDSSDYIKLSVVNNSETEQNVADCIITQIIYSDGGNKDVSFNNITAGDSINTVQAILGEPTKINGAWYQWSDGSRSINIEFNGGYVKSISR